MAGTGTESHADGSTSDAADVDDFEFCVLSSGALAGTGKATKSHADGGSASDADDDDFEFCILSSGAHVQAGKGAAETAMRVADELFSNGKLLPLRPSSAAGSDGPTYVLLPAGSESAASTAGFGSRSDSRSASSSGSSSGCVSRSQSSSSAASDHGATAPQRRSLSSSLFYAHPSPSPQLRGSRPRRSTGSAPPPAAWGVLRLGVVGVPDVYPPRTAEAKNAAVGRGGGSKSARFERASAAAVVRGGGGSKSARLEQASAAAADKKLGFGLFSDTLGCNCSRDAIEPVRLPAPAKQGRKKDSVKASVTRGRNKILGWLEELSIPLPRRSDAASSS